MLGPIKTDMLGFLEILEGFGQPFTLMLYKPTVQLVLNLMNPNETKEPARLVGSVLTETTLAAIKNDKSGRGIQYFYRQQMILAYYLGDLRLAGLMSSKLVVIRKEGRSSWLPARVFFQGLIAAALFKSGRPRYRPRAFRFLRKLKQFVKEGNQNCLHLYQLLKAEILTFGCRVPAKTVQREFDSVIAQCARSGIMHDQALGNELAGLYFLNQRKDLDWASTYLTRSYNLYRRWGAQAKTRQMEQVHGNLIEKSHIRNPSARDSGHNAKSRIEDMKPQLSEQIVYATAMGTDER
jgi:histidine kinase